MNVTNPIGFIMLRFNGIPTPCKYILPTRNYELCSSDIVYLSVYLASGFNLSDGRVEVTVPDVIVSDNYTVVCKYTSNACY